MQKINLLAFVLAPMLMLSACEKDGSNGRSAAVPVATVTTNSYEGTAKICQWLFSERLIASPNEPQFNVSILAPRVRQDYEDSQWGRGDRQDFPRGPRRPRDNSNNEISINGNCSSSPVSALQLIIKGNRLVDRQTTSETFVYKIILSGAQVTESLAVDSSTSEGRYATRLKRQLGISMVTLALSPGSLQLDLNGEGQYKSRDLDGYVETERMSFRTTVVLNTRAPSLSVQGDAPSNVYSTVRQIQ
ncbi:MAG: hypothetical protein H7061_01080 [Bdellovibrionaceae bacterium]|nr:hypothetical protein [Bdellovibrio sp.]